MSPSLRTLRAAKAAVVWAVAAVCVLPMQADAADRYWDANGAAANQIDYGGSWNTTNTNWWTGSTNVKWTSGDRAIFGWDNDSAAGNYIITLETNTVTNGLWFRVGAGYTLSPVNPLSTTTLSITGSGAAVQADADAGITIKIADNGTAPTQLTKTGAATLTLSNSNTYTGGTTLQAGTLRAGADTAFGTGKLTLESGTLSSADSFSRTIGNALAITGDVTLGQSTGGTGALAFGGLVGLGGGSRTITTDASVTFSNILSNGSLAKSGNGTLTLSNSGNKQSSTTLNAGTLRVTNGLVLGSGLLTLNGGTLASSDANRKTIANAVSIGGDIALGQTSGGTGALVFSGNVDLNNGTRAITAHTSQTFSGIVSNGGLIKAGNGALTLSAANTYSGDTRIAAGILLLGNSNAVQNSTLDYQVGDGTLSFNDQTQAVFGGLKGGKNLVLQNDTLAPVALSVGNNNADSVYSGILSGGGSLAKSGNGVLTFTADNTYTGATTISGGTLVLGADGATGRVAGPVEIKQGAALEIRRSGVYTPGNSISGEGTLVISGSGTTTLNVGAYSGGTTINRGTLKAGSASAFGSGTVRINSGGTLDLNGLNLSNVLDNHAGLTSITNTSAFTGTHSLYLSQAIAPGQQFMLSADTHLKQGVTLSNDGVIGKVTIENGGRLDGAGRAGAVAVEAGGIIAVSGNDIGTLTTGRQTWNSGGLYEVTILSAGTGQTPGLSDLLVMDALDVSGNFTLQLKGNASGLSLNSGQGFYQWVVATVTDPNSTFNLSQVSVVADFAAGETSKFAVVSRNAADGSKNLVVTYELAQVPEPTTLLLSAAGLLPLLLNRRVRT